MTRNTHLTKLIILLGTLALIFGGVATAYAESDIPLMIRVRGLGVMTDVDSDPIHPTLEGEADVDHSVGVEIDFTYFFTDNIASELVLGVAQHNVEAKNTNIGTVLGTDQTDFELGDVWLIPPTLLLQYHFMPDAKIRPYFGAGINYTIFFEEDEGLFVNDTSYDNSFGYAFQAGMDIGITENFAFNIDLKKLFLETEAEVKALGGTFKTDVDIDPWLLGAGIAYRF